MQGGLQVKKLILLLLTASLLAGCLAGCGKNKNDAYVPTGDALYQEGQDLDEYLGEEEKEQELSLAYYPDRSMNPLIGNNISNRALFSLIYQGLFAADSRNNVVPILCSEYTVSPNNMSYSFKVDPSAVFSDGSRVTINDVLATYEAAKSCDYYKGRFTFVDSFSLNEEGGISFFLTTPYENFPLLLDIPILKASEIGEEHPLGSGPYTFHESAAGAQLNRVRTWWANCDIPVFADTIPLLEASDQAAIRDAFEFSDVGLAVANPMSDSYASYRCDFELWEVDTGVFLYLGCNINFSDYFKDTDVLRKALTYAIDRETLIQENYRGMAWAATLPASPNSPYYSKTLAAKYTYDPMKFIDLIRDFRIPEDENGRDKKLRLLVNSADSARLRMARDIATALTELGIPTGTLEYSNATNGTTYSQVLHAGNYDLYLGQTKLSPNYDLSTFYGWGELSRGGITDKTIYGLCQDALANSGNYYNLHEAVANDGKIIPILFGYNTVYAKRGLFDGLSPSRDNPFFYTLGKTLRDIKVNVN